MAIWYGYYDPDRVLAAWPDAPVENEEILDFLLDVAKEQVLEFAPDPEELVDQYPDQYETAYAVLASPPARYVYAQLQQAKNLFNAGRAQEDGSVGGEGYSFIPRPLDKTIQKMIRPTSGVADVF